ncbi:hypothetical protein CH279_28655 [Rhodococcus sp. 06-412-2B]|nr:TIGR04222 domain-containing membrane protein [Rhodococcus sp. 06-412-2B]OZC90358.1 hypothetical protein CH279_28655 [Rhodococcus sp. 06-412-2B]
MDGTDTWGIASADFLRWYLLAAFVAVALVLLSNWLASHRSVPASPTGRVLTPPEVGALTNDTQAVMASLAILRGADVIDSRGRVRRALTDTERTHLDWFTRTVLERLGSGKAPLVRSRLVTNMSVACAQLRSQLIKEGLLHGRSERGASTVRVFPILFVAAVGFVRVISGIANGKPVLFLVGIIVLLLLTLPFVRRRRRTNGSVSSSNTMMPTRNSTGFPFAMPEITRTNPTAATNKIGNTRTVDAPRSDRPCSRPSLMSWLRSCAHATDMFVTSRDRTKGALPLPSRSRTVRVNQSRCVRSVSVKARRTLPRESITSAPRRIANDAITACVSLVSAPTSGGVSTRPVGEAGTDRCEASQLLSSTRATATNAASRYHRKKSALAIPQVSVPSIAVPPFGRNQLWCQYRAHRPESKRNNVPAGTHVLSAEISCRCPVVPLSNMHSMNGGVHERHG